MRRYICAILLIAVFAATYVLAVTLLPDPILYVAGPHKGEEYVAGTGIYFFSFYIAVMITGFGVFMPGICLLEWWDARLNH